MEGGGRARMRKVVPALCSQTGQNVGWQKLVLAGLTDMQLSQGTENLACRVRSG